MFRALLYLGFFFYFFASSRIMRLVCTMQNVIMTFTEIANFYNVSENNVNY